MRIWRTLSALAVVAGMGLLAYAAAQVHPALGIAVVGVTLVAAGLDERRTEGRRRGDHP